MIRVSEGILLLAVVLPSIVFLTGCNRAGFLVLGHEARVLSPWMDVSSELQYRTDGRGISAGSGIRAFEALLGDDATIAVVPMLAVPELVYRGFTPRIHWIAAQQSDGMILECPSADAEPTLRIPVEDPGPRQFALAAAMKDGWDPSTGLTSENPKCRLIVGDVNCRDRSWPYCRSLVQLDAYGITYAAVSRRPLGEDEMPVAVDMAAAWFAMVAMANHARSATPIHGGHTAVGGNAGPVTAADMPLRHGVHEALSLEHSARMMGAANPTLRQVLIEMLAHVYSLMHMSPDPETISDIIDIEVLSELLQRMDSQQGKGQ